MSKVKGKNHQQSREIDQFPPPAEKCISVSFPGLVEGIDMQGCFAEVWEVLRT